MGDLFYSVLTMNLLIVLAAWCLAKPDRRAAFALTAVAVVWVFASGKLEGDILWSFSRDHGVTMSDLLSVAAVAIAASAWRRARPAQ
ncbi:hypothetical protein ERC79_08555 [Rhodococcus sp. ABRD24]|nr:hypothetical protein ERC79_08555 [Rhodococcus sp. ABRD24]